MNAEPVEQIHKMRGETNADSYVADGVFKNQVPTDDPRDQLSDGRVSVRIGASRNGNHGRKLGIAKRGESAHDGY